MVQGEKRKQQDMIGPKKQKTIQKSRLKGCKCSEAEGLSRLCTLSLLSQLSTVTREKKEMTEYEKHNKVRRFICLMRIDHTARHFRWALS